MPIFSILLLILFPAIVLAQSDDFSADDILGQYLLTGKRVTKQQTYNGKVTIYREDNALKLKRVIDGKTIVGDVAGGYVLDGDTRVIRMRFKQAQKSYEEICQWQGDLKNYTHMRCYLYHPASDNRDSAMEVMYLDLATN